MDKGLIYNKRYCKNISKTQGSDGVGSIKCTLRKETKNDIILQKEPKMKQIEGIWWTYNQQKVIGKLEITEENKIVLTTYGKLYDTNIICGFAEGEKITLVNVEAERTDIYISEIYKDETEVNDKDENMKLKYCTYKNIQQRQLYWVIYMK